MTLDFVKYRNQLVGATPLVPKSRSELLVPLRQSLTMLLRTDLRLTYEGQTLWVQMLSLLRHLRPGTRVLPSLDVLPRLQLLLPEELVPPTLEVLWVLQ